MGQSIEIEGHPETKITIQLPKVVQTKKQANGYYYDLNGEFKGLIMEEGNSGNKTDVYMCNSKEVKKENEKEIIKYVNAILLKEKEINVKHDDFCYIAYIVRHEAGKSDLKELKCIAFTSYNRAKSKGVTWKKLLSTGYSSVPHKKPLSNNNNEEKSKLARKALFSVLKGDNDLTKGAEYWDGTDFLAWGNSERNPYNKLGQNKFDEYKFIEIPKDIYDSFLAANGSSTRYGDKGKHPEIGDEGTHTHQTKKIKEKILDEKGKPVLDKNGKETFKEVHVPHKIKYSIPAEDFKNKDYWKIGSFYYDTGVKTPYGISGTVSAGKSIFWKKTKTRLTSDEVIKK